MQNKQIFICTITGLATHYDIPAIAGKGVLYSSPISQPSVAMQYAVEPYKLLQELPSTVLSAIFLSIAVNLDIIEDKLTSYERNTQLSKIPKYEIIQGIHLIHKLTAKQLRLVPKYSMYFPDSPTTKEILMSFQGYLKTIRENITGTYYKENREAFNEEDKEDVTLLAIKKPSSSFKAYKLAYKQHLESLKDSELQGSKLLVVLKTVGQNNNLLEASSDARIKIIQNIKDKWITADISQTTKKLLEMIIGILQKTSPSPLEEKKFDRVSDTVVHRKTLAEVLAAKKSLTKTEASAIWQEAIADTPTLEDSYTEDSYVEEEDEEMENDDE